MIALPQSPHRIEGSRLRLRDICSDDANDIYAGWMNDPEVNRYTESRNETHTPASLRAYIEDVTGSANDLFLAIVVKDSDRHIGNIKLSGLNYRHGTADMGIIIGAKDCWGQGFASEAIRLLADYAFTEIGLHKLTAGSYSMNKGSISAFEKSGFIVEGVQQEQCATTDGRADVVLLGLVSTRADMASKGTS
ncbi:MAG: GNAT family N-acetyltransferase [Rhodospirillales bacterium]|nr:GNAT family N-acetyltransferase [Rhodospirillales bacterium]